MAGVEGVVLYIGGGEASHSAELMRMSNFFHFRGQEGWLTASAGEAREYNTPGTGVTIMPGPFLVNSRFPGGALQAYMGRIMTAVDVPTTNVPPGDPRSDLVVLNIEDPYPSDGTFWPFPGVEGSESRRNGPYARLRVIDGVPSNTLTIDDLPTNRPERGWTCIPIARLDRTANTGTVTTAMIKNLRSTINPWAGIQLPQEILDRLDDLEDAISDLGDSVDEIPNQKFPVPAEGVNTVQCYTPIANNTVFVNNTTFKAWPQEQNQNILVAPWANRLHIVWEIINAYFMTGSSNAGVDANVYYAFRFKLGYNTTGITYGELVEPSDVYYGPCPDKRANRPPIPCNIKAAGWLDIDPRDRGKVVNIQSQIRMATISNGRLHNGIIVAVPNVTTVYNVYEFKEAGRS